MFEIIDPARDTVMLRAVEVAPAFSARGARGLLGRDGLELDSGLLLSDPLRCIHTFGMRFAIDIVFLDRSLRVVDVASDVRPWRVRACRRGPYQLELAAGSATGHGFVPGRRVALRARHDLHGGQRVGESPLKPEPSSDSAHDAPNSDCPSRRGLRSVPLSVGSAGGVENHSERRSPCVRIC